MPGMRKACKFNHIAEKSKIPRKSGPKAGAG